MALSCICRAAHVQRTLSAAVLWRAMPPLPCSTKGVERGVIAARLEGCERRMSATMTTAPPAPLAEAAAPARASSIRVLGEH